jgi:hypothetical protein
MGTEHETELSPSEIAEEIAIEAYLEQLLMKKYGVYDE